MVASKHEFTLTEIKAGVLVITGVLVFALFFAAVNGWRPAQPTKSFITRVTDTVGMHKGSDVRFGGKLVGKVTVVDYDTQNPSLMLVRFTIAQEAPVNEESRAYITAVSLTSENHLEISTGDDNAKLLADGAEIPSTTGGVFGAMANAAGSLTGLLGDVQQMIGAPESKPAKDDTDSANPAASGDTTPDKQVVTVADIFRRADTTIANTNDFVGDVQTILQERKGDVKSVLVKVQEIEDATNSLLAQLNNVLSENRTSIDDSVTNVRALTDSVSEVTTKLADRFSALADALQETLDSTSELGKNSADLLKDNRADIEAAIDDLKQTINSIKQFSETLKEQPASVVRGKKDTGRKAE